MARRVSWPQRARRRDLFGKLLPRATTPRTRLIVGLACIGLICALALIVHLVIVSAGASHRPVREQATVAMAPPLVIPASDPAVLRPLTPAEALVWNARIPISVTSNPRATPFGTDKIDAADFAKSLDCLTAAIYYEAAVEADDGQRAVAQVVLNRVRNPAFAHTVCGVVFEGHERRSGCQFSFTCDGSLNRIVSARGWQRARTVAQAALDGYVYAPVGWATHYHTEWVVPYWASTLIKTTQIGAHIFYRWPGRWGTPPAFSAAYVPVEPLVFAYANDHGMIATDEMPPPVAQETVSVPDMGRPVLPGSGALPPGAGAPPSGTPFNNEASRPVVRSEERPVLPAAVP